MEDSIKQNQGPAVSFLVPNHCAIIFQMTDMRHAGAQICMKNILMSFICTALVDPRLTMSTRHFNKIWISLE